MTNLQLISHHLCPYVQRAAIVLAEKEIEHERTYIDLANKPEWFSNISPTGKVPVLQTPKANLFESQVIAEYLDEVTTGSLHPKDPLLKAQHRSWIEFGSDTLKLIGSLYSAQSKSEFEKVRNSLKNKLTLVEKEVVGPYFSGEEFTMVDAVWGPIFRYFDVFDSFTDLDLMKPESTLCKWRNTLAQRPSIINATPDGYPKRLREFLLKKNSYISSLMSIHKN